MKMNGIQGCNVYSRPTRYWSKQKIQTLSMPTIRLLFATTWLVAVKCRVSSKTVASICLRQLNLSQQSSSVLKSRLYLITTKTPAQITISRRRISRIVKRLTSQALQLPTRASLIQLLKRTPIYLIVTKEELLKRRKMVKMPLLP